MIKQLSLTALLCLATVACQGKQNVEAQQAPEVKKAEQVKSKASKKKRDRRDAVAKRFPNPVDVTATTQARLDQWFTDAKFGAFIHFGAYSPLAGSYQGRGEDHKYSEWIQLSAEIPAEEYHQIAHQFNPDEFDADEWVTTFKTAGMKYVVLTAKHHDGFALYNSAVSDYDITDKGAFQRDIVKELSESCKRHGLKFGVYYSQAQDWDDPNAPILKAHHSVRIAHPNLPESFEANMQNYIDEKALPQVEELVKNYPIDLIWFDTPVGITFKQAERFRDTVREHEPDAMINSRIILNAAAIVEQKHYELFDYLSVGDKAIAKQPTPYYYESPDSVTTSYAYKAHGPVRYHTIEELIHRMVRTVATNGNYLLNNGPMGNGKLDPKAVELYLQMGKWLEVNGESIWGTRANPFGKSPQWGNITTNKAADVLYLHVLNSPDSGAIQLAGIHSSVAEATYLANGKNARFQQVDGALSIQLPEQPVDEYNTVIKIQLKTPFE